MEKIEKKAEVPVPKDPKNLLDQFEAYMQVVRDLRTHCPWDRKQTNESIAHLLIEECYETIDAIHKGDDLEFSKELGDLLLHVTLHAVMAEERGAFDLIDVMTRGREKLVHRHPHVYGGVNVSGEEDVVRNWEALKMKEGKKSILDGVPKNLPSLLRAQRIQHKASKVGFDWDNSEGVWDKIFEEIEEFREEIKTGDREKASKEFGDILFALVNAARFEEIVAEEELQFTNDKFSRRFQYIEKTAKERGLELKKMTLEEMDALWDEAKEREK